MNKIEQAIIPAIKQYSKLPLIIAYSGGVDSQVLLHALASLKKKSFLSNPITVCHINHGLSDNAMQWQKFAEQQCQQVNLPLTVFQVNIQEQAQQSLEALARDARYTALHSVSVEPSIIMTGHHSDDQAETFLLALKRGSGLKGLSAIASEIKQGKDLLIRPLLNVSRAEIVEYANNHDLTWVEDESNSDVRFDRNFIRNEIMPLLTKRWPSISQTVNRSSRHCQEAQLLLDELAAEDLSHCQDEAKCLTVVELCKLSTPRFNNLIRYFLAQCQCLMPSTEQLAQLQQQLAANNDKNPAVKVGEHYFRRYKGSLYLTEALHDVSDWSADIDLENGNVALELPDALGTINFILESNKAQEVKTSELMSSDDKGQFIIMPKSSDRVSIKFVHNNPKCLPDYRNHSRNLKKVLQELNIAPWQRKRIPFLYYDDVLVAAIGYFVCQEFTAGYQSVDNVFLTLNRSS